MSTYPEHLHVHEFREQFHIKTQISTKDIQQFYHSIKSDIKENTVSWYIFKLKEYNVIRSIARGYYALNLEKNYETKGDLWVAITFDFISSTKMNDINFTSRLREIISELNESINRVFHHKRVYSLSQGDEIQILVPFNEDLGKLIMLTISYLYPLKARFAISIGKLVTDIRDNSWEMSESIFWLSRDHLSRINDDNDYSGRIVFENDQMNLIINKILPSTTKLIGKITNKQWEIIKDKLENISIENTIKRYGITSSSYYNRLRTSCFDEIIDSFDGFYHLITKEINR